MKRASIALATGLLASAGALGFAATASAADYPPKAPSMTIVGCIDVNTGIRVGYTDLLPGSTVTSTATRLTGSGEANPTPVGSTVAPDGTASATIPSRGVGTFRVDGSGTDRASQPWTGSVTVNVVSSCDAPTPSPVETPPVGGIEDSDTTTEAVTAGIADTGSTSGPIAALAVGALVLGGATVLVARSRGRARSDAS